MLSTAVLAAGTLIPGSLNRYAWWAIVLAGAALAIAQGWPILRDWKLGPRANLAAMIWLLAAIAAGLCLAGAMRPPGFIGMAQGDAYDVLEYHLQLPRQYFEAGQIGPLTTNCYSHYPLGAEMLFLLAMCLRGGAYEGAYLATLLHGFHAAAAAAVYMTLRASGKPRATFAAILLATAPGVIYLGWLAKTELAQVMYLALALLWLREWMEGRFGRQALCVGLMLGGACATKYTAVGIVALPVLAVMAGCAVAWRPSFAAMRDADGKVENDVPRQATAVLPPFPGVLPSLAHVLLAGAMVIALMAPWLIRNAAYVGNPLFPLASGLFGRGYWTDELQQRWAHGTGPQALPPVPVPPGWRPPQSPSRAELAYKGLLGEPFLSAPLVLLSLVAVLVAGCHALVRLLRKDVQPQWTLDRTWQLALAGVLLLQAGIWVAGSHELPWRFLLPAIATMALLSSGLLADLARWGQAAGRRTGLALAAGGLLAGGAFNLFQAWGLFVYETRGQAIGPHPLQDISKRVLPYSAVAELPPGSRVLLIGEAEAFYFPPGTLYATVFDPHPLEGLLRQHLSPEETLRRLRSLGVTHLYFDWGEILRLAGSYGFPSDLSWGVIEARRQGRPPTLPILEQLQALGMKEALTLHEPKVPWVTIYELP